VDKGGIKEEKNIMDKKPSGEEKTNANATCTDA
jgi:hypothetical protein